MSYSVLSDSFEYLCYGSTAIINIVSLSVHDRLYTSESDVYRCQVLTYKDDPRTVRAKLTFTPLN